MKIFYENKTIKLFFHLYLKTIKLYYLLNIKYIKILDIIRSNLNLIYLIN